MTGESDCVVNIEVTPAIALTIKFDMDIKEYYLKEGL